MAADYFTPDKVIAVDTETTGLNPWTGDAMFAISLCDESGDTIYWEWPVDISSRKPKVDTADVAEISFWLAGDRFAKAFHNAKFDLRMMLAAGIEVGVGPGLVHDTHIMGRVCNSDEMDLQLKQLAKRYLKIPIEDEHDLKEETKRCRRAAKQLGKETGAVISLGEEVEQDYWLPRFFDQENQLCEKYCRQDTVRTMGLYLMYSQIMENDPGLRKSYEEEMYDLWPVVWEMEGIGVRIDRDQVIEERYKAVEAKRTHYDAMVDMILEHDLDPGVDVDDFNPGSYVQLSRILYTPKGKGGLGLSTERITDAGNMSTDKNAIRELVSDPFVRQLVQYRGAEQSLKMFFNPYMELMRPDTKREKTPSGKVEQVLHPGFNQCGTVTFRFSCSNPNLQQVGNPDSSVNVISTFHPRAPFGPREGYYWYCADYKQQELRLFASISKNPFLMSEILAGRDPNNSCTNKAWGGKDNPQALKAAALAMELAQEHPSSPEVADLWEQIEWSAKAAKEFGGRSDRALELADWWLSQYNYEIVAAEASIGRKNSRARGKCVMFAKIYGGGPSAVTELLYCTLEEARGFMNDLDRAMPEVNEFMSETIRRVRRDGYIINPYDRKLRIDREVAYKGVNYLIQSTAALMMKDSMVRADRWLKETGRDARVALTIHDEVVYEIHKDHAYKWMLRGLCRIMEDNQGRIEVPMPVDMQRVRESWAIKEDVEL